MKRMHECIYQIEKKKRHFTNPLIRPEVAASDIRIYLNQMIDVRLKRECMLVLFIILTARVNGQMIRLVLRAESKLGCLK